MKKKTTIWTYFKRFLLIIIAFVVVIFVSVYFLGKYKAAGMTFNNEYPDDYYAFRAGKKLEFYQTSPWKTKSYRSLPPFAGTILFPIKYT